MSETTKAFFIVSSGRSGTAMLHKALSACEEVDMQHEYMVHIVQPLAMRRYHGLIAPEQARETLRQTHMAAIRYSEKPVWGDSSNKLSWLIDDLAVLLPQAKFVHLTRDGRKVTGSYFRKLADECYDDRSSAILAAHLADPNRVPAPPPEKKYWWPLPRHDDPRFARFDQFQRIAWHWAEVNRTICESLERLPADRSHFVRLEDVRASESELRALFAFLDLPYAPAIYPLFAKPHNVNKPVDQPLSPEQTSQFEEIAGAMQKRLGYRDRSEYVVNY